VAAQRLLDDALSGAWLADDEAETALLAVDAERVKNVLLLCEKNDILVVERVFVEAKVRAKRRD
jgi:hypothetical protein